MKEGQAGVRRKADRRIDQEVKERGRKGRRERGRVRDRAEGGTFKPRV